MKLRGSGRGRRIAVKAGWIKRAVPAAGQPSGTRGPARIRRRERFTPARLAYTKPMLRDTAALPSVTHCPANPHRGLADQPRALPCPWHPRRRWPNRHARTLGRLQGLSSSAVARAGQVEEYAASWARTVDGACPRLGSAEGQPHEITAGADTQFLVGVPEVVFHGSPAQEQLSGHVSIGAPAADQVGDLLLLRGQLH